MASIGSNPVNATQSYPQLAPPAITIPPPVDSNGTKLNLVDLAFIAGAESIQAAMMVSRMFGIGLNTIKVIPTQILGNNNVSTPLDQSINTLVKNTNKQISQDAVPDGKGGYSQNPSKPFWNARTSSILGSVPVMTSVTFGRQVNGTQGLGGSDLSNVSSVTYTSLSGTSITIPVITFEMVLIKMKQGKNIEITDITGRDTGSVAEYISQKDWNGTFEVVITASQNVSLGMENVWNESKYPEENMEVLDLLISAPIAIPIICPYMNKRGINFVILEDGIDISQIAGEYEAQKITIPWRSNNPLVLQLVSG